MVKAFCKPLLLVALFAVAACSAGTTNSSIPGSQSVSQQSANQATAQTQTRTALGDKQPPPPPPPPPPPKRDGTIVYDSIPNPLISSAAQGFACCGVSEFGDGVNLAKLKKNSVLDTVTVAMGSYGCETGSGATCSTTPGATFNVPITLHVYAVGSSPYYVGALLATQTQTFAIPYRPSADPTHCTGSNAGLFYRTEDQKFYSGPPFNIHGPQAGCDQEFPSLIVFDNIVPQAGAPPNLPSQVIVTLAFTPAGPASSLNVSADSIAGGPVSVGSYYDLNGVFGNYASSSLYCTAGHTPGILQLDADASLSANCPSTSNGGNNGGLGTPSYPYNWSSSHPQIQVTVDDKKDKDDKGPGK
jgi:hypothetical protein